MSTRLPVLVTISVIGVAVTAMYRMLRSNRAQVFFKWHTFQFKLMFRGSCVVFGYVPVETSKEQLDASAAAIREEIVHVFNRLIDREKSSSASSSSTTNTNDEPFSKEKIELTDVTVLVQTGEDAIESLVDAVSRLVESTTSDEDVKTMAIYSVRRTEATMRDMQRTIDRVASGLRFQNKRIMGRDDDPSSFFIGYPGY